MPNYKEATVTAGTKWTRAWQVVIENRYGKVPFCEFREEIIVDTGNEVISTPVNGRPLHEEFGNPSTSFNLVNPTDGSTIGTATYQDVYVMLSSLYLALALKRDSQ